MKIFQTVVIATTMLAVNPSLAYCEFRNGSKLLDNCATIDIDGADKAKLMFCLGYVAAIADTFSCSDPLYGYYWKPSEQLSNGQLGRVVLKWLQEHPEKLHFSAPSLVAGALEAAFPCH